MEKPPFFDFPASYVSLPECSTINSLHPGRLTWNLQITHLERKMIFQTSMTMVHVNLPGCTLQKKTTQVFFCHSSIIPPLSMTNSSIWHLDQRSEGMRTIDFDITRHQLPGKNSEKEQRKLQELAKVSRNLWCFCLDVWKTCFRGKKTFDNVKKMHSYKTRTALWNQEETCIVIWPTYLDSVL